MDRPDLTSIRQRAETATAGPWEVGLDDDVFQYATGKVVIRSPYIIQHPDLDFIARAREDIPALLAYIEALEGRPATSTTEPCRSSEE